MKKVALHNLGCKVNAYETEAMRQLLEQAGYEIGPFDAGADIYIINTCTVTNIADRKSRQMLHRAKKLNPEALMVAAGCYVQAAGEKIQADDSIDLVIGNNKKKDLISILQMYEEGRQAEALIDINHTKEYEELSVTGTAEHTRAYVKVQDGCNQFCSYCIIPYARGRIRSRELSEVLDEVRTLAGNGYREVVLTGIHLSSYGMTEGNDFSKSRLLSLIREVQGVPGIERIRLGSLEPRIITEEFAAGLKACDKLCPHFHLSLQSGCNEVLKRMNRKYSTEEYYEKVKILRRYFEEPAITTDVIVGFPGETDEEFEKTKSYLAQVGFYEMHVFKYSKRKGTPAAAMDGQIPEEIKARRSGELLALEKEMSRRYREKHLHKKAKVLFEEEKTIDGRSCLLGFTGEYIRAAVMKDGAFAGGRAAKDGLFEEANLSGKILSGELTGFLTSDILVFQPQIH